jgi:hypothetical protein
MQQENRMTAELEVTQEFLDTSTAILIEEALSRGEGT